MSEFWLPWSAWWFGVATFLISFMFVVANQNAAKFLAEGPIYALASRAVYAAYKMADDFFGHRLLSYRAFVSSIALSTLAFLISFLIAAVTIPDFWHPFRDIFRTNHWETPQFSRYEIVTSWATLVLVFVGLLFEFIYVTKSRLILRTLRVEQSYARLLAIFLIDIASTFFIYILMTPLTMLIVLNVFGAITSSIDVKDSTLAVLGWTTAPKDVPLPIIFDATNFFQAYPKIVQEILRDVVVHIRAHFVEYHYFIVAPIIHIPGTQEYQRAIGFDVRHAIAIGPVFPETTMLASAFATTAWVGIAALVLSVVRLSCHTFRTARRTFEYLHLRPHVLFWLAIGSVVICIVGGIIHEI